MEAMFETMDLDKDGRIDFGEFVAALQVADVVRWLEGKGLSEYRQAFSGMSGASRSPGRVRARLRHAVCLTSIHPHCRERHRRGGADESGK